MTPGQGEDLQQGWASWAWSYVPQILPDGEEEGVTEEGTEPKRKPEPTLLAVGLYCEKASVTFKVCKLIPCHFYRFQNNLFSGYV